MMPEPTGENSEIPKGQEEAVDEGNLRQKLARNLRLMAEQSRPQFEASIAPKETEKLKDREQLEKVRAAKYVELDVEHLEGENGLEGAYGKALISPNAIDCLIAGDNAGVEEATKNGCFVFGFRETTMSKDFLGSSVWSNLRDELSKPAQPGRGHYRLRGLVGPDHRLLAAAWWTQACQFPPEADPDSISFEHYEKDLKYLLRKGNTGIIEYSPEYLSGRKQIVQFLKKLSLSNCAFYDTLLGLERFAAMRLNAELEAEMLAVNPNLQYIFLYILNSLSIEPNERQTIVRFGQNWSSRRFFEDRRFRRFADDFNKDGPRAMRTCTAEDTQKEYAVLPAWAWYIGEARETAGASNDIWENKQKELGFADVSVASGKPQKIAV